MRNAISELCYNLLPWAPTLASRPNLDSPKAHPENWPDLAQTVIWHLESLKHKPIVRRIGGGDSFAC